MLYEVITDGYSVARKDKRLLRMVDHHSRGFNIPHMQGYHRVITSYSIHYAKLYEVIHLDIANVAFNQLNFGPAILEIFLFVGVSFVLHF